MQTPSTAAVLMTAQVPTCLAHDDLDTVICAMIEREVDCVPVVDARGRLLGTITTRDICAALFGRDRPTFALTAEQAMRHDVVSIAPGETLHRARRMMRSGCLRELAVVDGARRVLGLLAIDDLLYRRA